MSCCRCRGEERRCIGADREEAGDAGIEQAAKAPLHVERKTEDGVDAAGDQEGDQIEEKAHRIHQKSLPLSRPCGRKMRSSTMIKKAVAVL